MTAASWFTVVLGSAKSGASINFNINFSTNFNFNINLNFTTCPHLFRVDDGGALVGLRVGAVLGEVGDDEPLGAASTSTST
jgi:hypothetical protein